MKKWVKVLIATIMITIVILISIFISTSRELKKVRTMSINNVNLYNIDSGTYPGSFNYGGFTYKVKVTVWDQKITKVEIVNNRDSEYAKKAEGVVRNVIKAQALNVDTISGATTTSKALLKAIENALTGGE
ncbi:FMN-binding protein [Candidatus Margulisiibacteriota bacterium]